jgi:endonuclease/exonuclease/phosphatase family metal-dependent hydrolase
MKKIIPLGALCMLSMFALQAPSACNEEREKTEHPDSVFVPQVPPESPELPVPPEPPVPPASDTLRIMSLNIRYENLEDAVNNWWLFRKERMCQLILRENPDVIGTQEVLDNQLKNMLTLLPGYGYVGVGREDGKTKGEYSAIFYRKSRFEVVESQTFWLSEDPTAVGKKGWDAACERIVTWARMKEKASSKEFYLFNTHFDHVGVTARRESAALLKRQIKAIAGTFPVLVTGDLNVSPSSDVITSLRNPEDPDSLKESRSAAATREGPAYTFHDFGRIAVSSRQIIDYIFLKNAVTPLHYKIVVEKEGEAYISDHHPVVLQVKF